MGSTIAQIDAWPAEIAKITAEQIRDAAIKHLDIKRSVTGTLRPETVEAPAAPATPAAAPAKKS